MAESIKKDLWGLLQLVEGLKAIVITDNDGIPVLKVSSDITPEASVRPAFLATFATAADQASKLGLSANKSIICVYHAHQVIHFNKDPLFVSLIASKDANTGLLCGLDKELDGLLTTLKTAIAVK